MQTVMVWTRENRKGLLIISSLFATAWLLFFLMSNLDIFGIRSARLSVAQYFIAPIIILTLLFPLRNYLKIPLLIPLLAGTGVVASALVFFNLQSDSFRDLYVARLKGDLLDADTRILRERLKQSISGSYPFTRLAPYYNGIYSMEEAEHFLQKRKEAQALVWGGETLTLSFPQTPPLALEETGIIDSTAWSEMTDGRDLMLLKRLKIVTSFPYVQLSKFPLDGTSDFLARAFNGYLSWNYRGGLAGPAISPLEEAELLAAIAIDSPWVSREHISFPYFVLGNAYFKKAFSGNRFEPGYLECAEAAYRKAASGIHERRNPELRAAIFNNAAVVRTLQFVASQKLKDFNLAYKLFHEAVKEGGRSSVYKFKVKRGKQSREIARGNQARLIKIKREVRSLLEGSKMAGKKHRKKLKRKRVDGNPGKGRSAKAWKKKN